MSSKARSLAVRLFKNKFKINAARTPEAKRVNTIFDVSSIKEFESRVKCCEKPVVVNFHASWCTPCIALQPRLVKIVKQLGGRVNLARVDIDELTELALDYNITSVPSTLLMHKGRVREKMVGLETSAHIRDWLQKIYRKIE